MFHQNIEKPRTELKNTTRTIFDENRGVRIADEILSQLFDTSFQSKQNPRSKPAEKQSRQNLC